MFTSQTELLLTKSYHSSIIEPILYSNNPGFITISLLPCPLGFMIKLTRLSGAAVISYYNRCLEYSVIFRIRYLAEVDRSGWVAIIKYGNANNTILAASQYCPLNNCIKCSMNVTLTKPDWQCHYNHSGILCGGCQPGLSLALGSSHCQPCTDKYLALLIPFTLAGPVLVGFIKLLYKSHSISRNNEWPNILCQHYSSEFFFPHGNQLFPCQYSYIPWLNLDFGIETCFFHGLNTHIITKHGFNLYFHFKSGA